MEDDHLSSCETRAMSHEFLSVMNLISFQLNDHLRPSFTSKALQARSSQFFLVPFAFNASLRK
jgi:hypothetical protein